MPSSTVCEIAAACTIFLVFALPALLQAAVVRSHAGGLPPTWDALLVEHGNPDSPNPDDPDAQNQLHSSQKQDESAAEGSHGTGCIGCARERQRLRREASSPEGARSDEIVKKLRLDMIKQRILDKLGLKHRPNITSGQPRPSIPEPLLRDLDTIPAYSGPAQEGNGMKPTEIITFGTQGKLSLLSVPFSLDTDKSCSDKSCFTFMRLHLL